MNKLRSDRPFFASLAVATLLYVFLVLAIVLANLHEIEWISIYDTWSKPEVVSAIRLTLMTSSITAILAIFFSVPIAYALARFKFRGRAVVDAVLDIPLVLPPLVIGLSLLIFFNKIDFLGNGQSLEQWLNSYGMAVTFAVPAIILAQFTVATAYAVRMVRNTFAQIDERAEQVALTLGCNRAGAFWRVALPQAGSGIVAAGVMAFARAMGEFGPILVFAGATRGKTEVLSTSVFLELNMGNLTGAAALSLLMMILSLGIITIVRFVTRSQTSSI